MAIKIIFSQNDNYNKNVILNYLFKVIAILLGLLNTKLTLKYLGPSSYGLWVTITSVINCMSSGDLGIGNGLRNELAKAYGKCDVKQQRQLIAAAVHNLNKLAVVLMIIILILCEILFNTDILVCFVRIPTYITAIFFCINLVLGIAQSIVLGYQNSWLNSCAICLGQLSSILFLGGFIYSGIDTNLIFFAILNGLCTTFSNLFLICILRSENIFIFNKKSNYDKSIQKSIMNTGVRFFGIQLCSVILYSTDSLIINKILNSEMVTKYAIISKIYDTGTNLFSILLIALWSAVTYHIAQNNYQWVKRKIRQLLVFWSAFSVGVIIVSLLFNSIIEIWLGKQSIYYEPELVAVFGLYCIITALSSIFANVLNGMGIIKLQLLLAIIEAVLNIPMSIFFAVNCDMGILGVKLATLFCVIATAIIIPVQVAALLKTK